MYRCPIWIPAVLSIWFSSTICVAAPPNVLLIISDDQAWGDYGFMGHPHIETPHLDRLAAESLTFTRGYVPDSLCRPSLATIVTGLYPHQHGIVGNDPPVPQALAELPKAQQRQSPLYLQARLEYLHHIDRVPTIAGMLGEELGYLSHQSGKWWEGHYRRGGFTHGMTHGDRTRGGRHGDDGLTIGREGLQPVFDFIELAQTENRPFFAYYAPFMPHTPHNPPERLLDKYRDKTPHLPVAKYWAMCEWFDETVGELLSHLDEQGLTDDTLVLYVTDNGWINDTEASKYAPRSKRSQYDGGIRTPIMVRWPGHVEPHIDREHLASSVDLVPTILAATGLEPTDEMQGINLLDAEAVADRKAIYGEILEHDIVDMNDPVSSLRYRWIIDGQWKLIVPWAGLEPDAKTELFRITQDNDELRDAAADYPQVVEELTAKLNAWWNPAADPNQVSDTRTPTPDTRPPNIVFFLSDDQRADFLSCAGHPIVQTPFLDDLAQRGVRFENAFVTTAICAASRATLFTGLWERSHKFTFGTPPIAEDIIQQSYPVRLREAGFRTGFVGKFGVQVPKGAERQMFDVFEPLNRNPYFKKQPDGTMRHLTDIIGDSAIDFIRECDGSKPFCLSVSFNAAHAEDSDKENHYPWPPSEAGFYENMTIPPPLVETEHWRTLPSFLQHSMHRDRWFWRWDTPEKYQHNSKAYFRMITGLDRNIGRVLNEVARKGFDDNTVIIFMGDNGYYQGSRGFAGKWSHFDESLRVPLIFFDPRLPDARRGRVDSQMVLNVDVPATIVSLATGEVSTSYQGRDLTPLLIGNSLTTEWRTDFFCEHLFDHPDIPKWEGVRDQRYMYARYFENLPEGEFLHDLEADPLELTNLVNDPAYAETLEVMRQRCDSLRDELGGEYSKERFPSHERN
ncbi:MAG: sulfatase-like hydrolase/transferase [Planctomycetaceae bacterium]|nr:sulfatase-like hydrolase/transferase [Planctomycetaceae bacterium]